MYIYIYIYTYTQIRGALGLDGADGRLRRLRAGRIWLRRHHAGLLTTTTTTTTTTTDYYYYFYYYYYYYYHHNDNHSNDNNDAPGRLPLVRALLPRLPRALLLRDELPAEDRGGNAGYVML